MNIIETAVTAPDANIAIVVARCNSFINRNLLDGASDTLKRIGCVKDENITVIWVPGAYELPLVVKIVAKTKKYDAVIALGTVIRGHTMHFEHIANSVCNNLTHIAKHTEIPVTLGVLTTKNTEQAIERAGNKAGNKGMEAALAALEMINIIRTIKNDTKHNFYRENL